MDVVFSLEQYWLSNGREKHNIIQAQSDIEFLFIRSSLLNSKLH